MLALIALSVLHPTPKLSCCDPSMAAFASDREFLAIHSQPLPFKFQSVEGKQITFSGPDGDHPGYYVAGKGAAVVMVHEYWGLNDYIRQEAVRLHHATGYGVLAVDLYQGKVAKTSDEAGQLMQAVKTEEATATVHDAVQNLVDGKLGTAYPKLGAIGWCFGGGWSLQTAISGGNKVKACVMYYGMPDDDQGDLAKLKAPVLLMEALQDKWISPEVVGKFKVAMKEAHKSLAVKTYDANHAFANPSSPRYDKEAAEDAMTRSLAFLKKHLG